MPAPVYTPENCRFAYQLNWSLSIFALGELPPSADWLQQLCEITEPDGVRILEHRIERSNVHQFLLSTRPHVSPAQAIRSVKGRLQYLIRDQIPQAFRRNYHFYDLGAVRQALSEKSVLHRDEPGGGDKKKENAGRVSEQSALRRDEPGGGDKKRTTLGTG